MQTLIWDPRKTTIPIQKDKYKSDIENKKNDQTSKQKTRRIMNDNTCKTNITYQCLHKKLINDGKVIFNSIKIAQWIKTKRLCELIKTCSLFIIFSIQILHIFFLKNYSH